VPAGYTGDDDESYDRYTDENRRFHYSIGLASGNMELAQMIGHLHDRLARFMVLRHAGKSQEVTHARIIEALEAHDIDLARQSLLEDIATSQDAILDSVLDEVTVSNI
jgi:DNA-binding GntR family transcriptional regulator